MEVRPIRFKQWLSHDEDADKYRTAMVACYLIPDPDLRELTTCLIRETALEYFNRNVSPKTWHDDPIEKIINRALVENGIPTVRNYPRRSTERGVEMDFRLPCKVSIEVKRYHTDRALEVLRKNKNIIYIQGQQAAITFEELLGRNKNTEYKNLKNINLKVSL